MAASVLNSPKAVEMTVFVTRAFVRMREMLAGHGELVRRLESIERKLLWHHTSLQEIYREIRVLRQHASGRSTRPNRLPAR